MPYQLDRRPDNTVQITARLEPEHVESERDEILRAFRRRAAIPGFRPGKAPLQMVRTRFADEVSEELQQHLAERVWHEVITGEERFEPISDLRVRKAEMVADGAFELEAEVDVRPRYELPAVEELALPTVEMGVSEAEVEEELEKARQEHGTWVPVEDEPAAEGMLAEVDLSGAYPDGDGEPFSSENVSIRIGDDEVFPEINEALLGAKPGEVRETERRFPDDFKDADRAGKLVTYRLEVKGLKRMQLPPVDDELAKSLGFEGLDALRERVREVVASRKKAERRATWRRALLDQLEEGIDVNALPSSLVRAALQEEMERSAFELAMRGVDPKSADVNWQELASKLEPVARRKVVDSLVLEQLAEAWEVGVPEAEVEAYIVEQARRQGLPPAEHHANLEKEGRLADLRNAARTGATVDELIRRAGGKED